MKHQAQRIDRMPDLIGICLTCEDAYWFPAASFGQPCPADREGPLSERDEHEVAYYRRTNPRAERKEKP
jgi:hypothetical protein